MLNRVKIKFVNAVDGVNVISVSVPYKNGMVGWNLYLDDKTWLIDDDECPSYYRTRRVAKAHRQFLGGVKLHKKLIRSAAAQHQWGYMDMLRKMGR